MLQSYETERIRAVKEGRTAEAAALDNMMQRNLSRTGMQADVMGLPSQIGLTNAQTESIKTDTTISKLLAPAQIEQAFANIDLTNATVDTMLTNLAYLDQMQYTTMGIQIRNIGQALVNNGLMLAFGNTEQAAVQNVLSMTYADWANAMAIAGIPVENTMNLYYSLMGLQTVENIVQPGDKFGD